MCLPCVLDYGFEYSDEEPEEEDVDIENQYYNAKGEHRAADGSGVAWHDLAERSWDQACFFAAVWPPAANPLASCDVWRRPAGG